MQTAQPWYIGLRSEALAKVYLTRRYDLIVSQQKQGIGALDFSVIITQNGNYTGRIFGVEVKATPSSNELIQNDDTFQPKNIRKYNNLHIFKDLPFPVCLFFFTLDNDKGYYRWILEPSIKNRKKGDLKFNKIDKLKKLNYKEIDNIVERVNSWYDQRISESQTGEFTDNLSSSSLLNFIDDISSEIPQSEWEKLPSDLSKNLDHYLYGSPKSEE